MLLADNMLFEKNFITLVIVGQKFKLVIFGETFTNPAKVVREGA